MSRLLTAEYVYSGSIDDCFNESINTTATREIQQDPVLQLQSHQHHNTSGLPSNALISCSNSHDAVNTQETKYQNMQEQQIHTISSSDEDEFVIQESTFDEERVRMSSVESGDFEGFDDTTANSNDIINDTSRENFNMSDNYLKRQPLIYKNADNVNIEQIEVDDEEIAVADDGKIICTSIPKQTQNTAQICHFEPYTPNKRKKHDTDINYNTTAATQLKTPPDQIVEINSDSTTNSLKQKRQQINNKLQLHFSQKQNHKAPNNTNKCSSESTSEFPVSSPSNPQQPRGGKYPARPPLLKNTLPADSFERQLAMLTACNPQMTLAEKIQSWDCEEELSDVEDVNKFDEEFKRLEKQKKIKMKQKEKGKRVKSNEIKNFDLFRQMILNNIKEQKNQKCNASGQTVSGGPLTCVKCVDTSGSESSKSVAHADDRPSTSALAQQQLQQRRSKAPLCFESGELKKRGIKDVPKRNQNSTTPPQTSSSDNERECFKNSKINVGQRQIHIHDTLICPSSSEEAISQELPAHVLLKTNNKCAQVNLKSFCKKNSAQPLKTNTASKTTEKKPTKNSRLLTDEEIDSVFRLHRLNRERDKYNRPSKNEIVEESTSIIQMRLDYIKDSKSEPLVEKKQDIFKTPIIPQKYLANPIIAPEYKVKNSILLTQKLNPNDEVKRECLTTNSLLKINDIHNGVNQEKFEIKSTVDDLDGVYHQQHEFCNYLGLTGMSTAAAMANAVAELAQCNLARRSMRVLRQQQQERRENFAKEKRLLEALKLKQPKEISKRERGSCYVTDAIGKTSTETIKSEGSHSQESEYTNSLKKTSNCTTKSSTKSQNSLTTVNKSEIINKVKGKTTKLSSMHIKQVTPPIRHISLRQPKYPMPEKATNIGKEEHNNDEIGTKGIQLNKLKIDCAEDIPLTEKENIRVLRSSISLMKNKRRKTQILYEPKEVVQNQAADIINKLESMTATGSCTKIIENKSCSNFLKRDILSKDEIHNEISNVEDLNLFNQGEHIRTATPNVIQQKLQMALEQSRKSKPSIFIVQSIDSKQENCNNVNIQRISQNNVDSAMTGTSEVHKCKNVNNGIRQSSIASIKKLKKKDERKIFKSRKGKRYPIQKRQLRKRKLIVIKTLKPKRKSYDNFKAIKRELRSSPKSNEIHTNNSDVKKNDQNCKDKETVNKMPVKNKAKSYRTVQTETKDFESYLYEHNYQTKTRLMVKALPLLNRSKRANSRGLCKVVNNKSKFAAKIQISKHSSHVAGSHTPKTKSNNITIKGKTNRRPPKIQHVNISEQMLRTKPTAEKIEVDNVIVSSTTNTYDERPNDSLAMQSPRTLRSGQNPSSPIKTKDQITQCNLRPSVHCINTPPSPTHSMRNPLKSDHGAVLYVYHELDILIVLQERLVSFWKFSKLINMLINPNKPTTCTHATTLHDDATLLKPNVVENFHSGQLEEAATSSTLIEQNDCGEWNQLGELRRLNFDFEVSAPYANRICLHNSTPIYLEMRAQQLPKNHRDCNLLSMYINIYYYHDEDMIAKCNSIPLDSIQSDISSINYTTLIDSRYFIMTWPQENLLGKTRSGLCKYSLTPQLDTLASIREFKSMRHTILYLECMNDDKLIGFGETQVSIWDYRSGDVLMNFDLEIPIGKNLGSTYFSSQDIEQNSMLILHQFRDSQINNPPELITIVCAVTHSQPSYRVLQEISLSLPAFKVITSAIKTGDHLIVTGQNGDELWVSLTNPRLMTVIPNIQKIKRFYNRERSQLIELSEEKLNVDTLANRILQLAAG